MREINEDDLMEKILSDQIPEFEQQNVQEENNVPNEVLSEHETPNTTNAASQFIGKKLTHNIGKNSSEYSEESKRMIAEKQLTRVGERIQDSKDIRDGWMNVDKRLLGERAKFYPTEWEFRIRPANVEAIRNWSTIDDENPNSIDDVFNEILKSCVTIITPQGPLPWGNIRSWDRFFFILLIREYTFVKGEKSIQFSEDCPNCGNDVTFTLTSMSLEYDMPDPEVMRYFSAEQQNWMIDPLEYDVNEEPITLYLPTLEKDAAIKSWMISRIQAKKKIDNVFIKFLPWLAPKISKDEKVAERQIREYEFQFKNWDTDMFSLMDEIVKNIMVTPASRLITKCPVCGEEVTGNIQFPNGVRSIFSISSGRKKFGKK